MHPNSLEVVTKMGYGTSYTQMQQADAFRAAADNPGGGGEGLAGLGIGMMGVSAMNNQQQPQQMQQPVQQQPAAASGGGAMPDVMNVTQAAEVLQVAIEDVIEAIQAGDLKARKIGSQYRISKANMEAFLNG